MNVRITDYFIQENIAVIKNQGIDIISSWMKRFPRDKDVQVFKSFVARELDF